jgi:hypothetical protein
VRKYVTEYKAEIDAVCPGKFALRIFCLRDR